jgi:hypothetical protein
MPLIALDELHLLKAKVEGLQVCRGLPGVANFETRYRDVALNVNRAWLPWYMQRHDVGPIRWNIC